MDGPDPGKRTDSSQLKMCKVMLQVSFFWPGFTNPTGPVKPPPSSSGLADRFDRKPVEFKFKFKIACATGLTSLPVGLTGLPVGMTGLEILHFFNLNLNFELGPVDRFDWFTGRFDRFTSRYDRFGNFYFLKFKFEFWIGAGLIPAQTITGPDRFGRLFC